MDLSRLEKQIGTQFQQQDLFRQAFTHTSYAYERRNEQTIPDNERLEYLGDAVLELTVSEYLFENYPKMSEGEMTQIRARVVCEPSLASFAKELHFGEYVLLGRGEEMSGGRIRPALLADLFEAFIGALYLDQGLKQVRTFLHKIVFPQLDENWLTQVTDAKSQLQELIQKKHRDGLSYHIVNTQGPDHDRYFIAEVRLQQQVIGRGEGKSKKEAEQQAAFQALQTWT